MARSHRHVRLCCVASFALGLTYELAPLSKGQLQPPSSPRSRLCVWNESSVQDCHPGALWECEFWRTERSAHSAVICHSPVRRLYRDRTALLLLTSLSSLPPSLPPSRSSPRLEAIFPGCSVPWTASNPLGCPDRNIHSDLCSHNATVNRFLRSSIRRTLFILEGDLIQSDRWICLMLRLAA